MKVWVGWIQNQPRTLELLMGSSQEANGTRL